MRLLFDIGHPAHVHLFRHTISALRRDGHSVLVTAGEKDVTTHLLRSMAIPYVSLGHPGRDTAKKGARLVTSSAELLSLARRFSPDVLVAVSPVRAAPVARLLGRPCVGLDDTEYATLARRLYLPFVTTLLTPECYGLDLGRKQVRYRGYHELAYLSPYRFRPDPTVVLSAGVSVTEPFTLVRFVAWEAAHDVGQGGFSARAKVDLVQSLSQYGPVLVSSEAELPRELQRFALKSYPHLIHHFLYYAAACVTEGATTASEAAVLGTPTVYMNSHGAGTLDEQQKRYGLVFNVNDRREEDKAIRCAVELVRGSDRRNEWRARSARMVRDHIDLTDFLLHVILLHGLGFRTCPPLSAALGAPDYRLVWSRRATERLR